MPMEDRFLKYSKLYALIFLLFLSVPVLIGLLIFAGWGVSKTVSSAWADVLFGLGIVAMPSALFLTVYLIFFRRTRAHPETGVRYLSFVFFALGAVFSIYALVSDLLVFFRSYSIDIGSYTSYSLLYMAGNIASLFFIALLQALTTRKEADWFDKHR